MSNASHLSPDAATRYDRRMRLDPETVRHIATLARVHLTDDEVSMLAGQLSGIIEHFDVLSRIDTEGIEPTAHTLPLRNVFADDVARPSMPRDEVLALAPLTEGGYLRVRAVLE
jgi:aspartyl-tRNA(Asn)/glutamyl-tRNA(Gln) amidotransferase subunit C